MLHSFTGGDDGHSPEAGLIFDSAGNLYGTAWAGSLLQRRCRLQADAKPDGTWTETVLYNFPPTGPQGAQPEGIIFDSAGNLYGTTWAGGTSIEGLGYIGGTVFKLAPSPDGAWTETVVHDFCSNGSYSNGALLCPTQLSRRGISFSTRQATSTERT